MFPSGCNAYRLRESRQCAEPASLQPFGDHAGTGAERLLLKRFERRDTTAELLECLAGEMDRSGRCVHLLS